MLFLFVDGFGLGADEPELNPVAAARTPTLGGLLGGQLTSERGPLTEGGFVYRPLDATLGVEGLPQSATGQTTLLTGRNGAAAMGRHYGPWPGPTLRPLLEEGTLFHDAKEGGGATFANAYPDDFFRLLGTRRFRPNAPLVAASSAGVELRGMERYRRGEAVAADLSGARFARAAGVEPQSPEAAAGVLLELAETSRFTFFDLWLTDTLGHARDRDGAVALVERLDRLLGALLEGGAGERFTLLLTSDHGNLEDLSTRGHTLNEVPLLVIGEGAREFREAGSLLDVAPAVRRLWGL